MKDTHPNLGIRLRRAPISTWVSGPTTFALYACSPSYGCIVSDASEFGSHGHIYTLKLISFTSTEDWAACDFFASHLCESQVEHLMDEIAAGKITADTIR